MNKSAILAVLLALCLVLIACLSAVSFIPGAKASEMPDVLYYTDYATKAEVLAAGVETNKQLLAEGITLLKNEKLENGKSSLPLAANAGVSVFGKRSANLLYGGSGSGAGTAAETMTVAESLTAAGLRVNSILTDFYEDTSKSGARPGDLIQQQINAGLSTGETPVSVLNSYADELEPSYDSYNDAAIVVIGRCGGESMDLPKSMSTGFDGNGDLNKAAVTGARAYDDHYLQLDAYETELLDYVCEKFDNVIVVLNMGSQFETGFLDDPTHYAYHENIKSALWIGFPGTRDGFGAFGEIIAGIINPSGRTVDTYARDFKKDPTWCNMYASNKGNMTYTNNGKWSFVDYEEGIYSGYRYYETRGYEEEKAGNGDWYGENVVYPFGHGLSYTSFEWTPVGSVPEDGSPLSEDETIEVSINVKNTSEEAGKDVVQLYYTAPYTPGGIEKPHVVLGDFAKTRVLQPGEDETVTLRLPVRDMASYDDFDLNGNGFKGYELDPGNYTISVSRDAHTPIVEFGFKIDGDGFQYRTNEKGNEVVNRFDDVGNKITKYMTRDDFDGSFPQPATSAERVMSDEVRTAMEVQDYTKDDPSDPWYTETMPVTGNNTGHIKLADLYGLPIDDPQWDAFMDQLAVGNKNTGGMVDTVWRGGWQILGVDGLGVPTSYQDDGPSGFASHYSGDFTNFACETVTASTWNRELAYAKGRIIGNEALFGNEIDKMLNGIYAPAINLHRSPFGGRNFEYFSEDSLLSGEMSGSIVKACNDKGVITFLKHFVGNDQETNRGELHTWMSEQTLRELYLRPFEICVMDYDSHGIMTALNSIGAVWAGGNYTLITEVLRGEWGFDGIVMTDYVQNRAHLNGNQMIRAGGDLVLITGYGTQSPTGLDSPTTVACLKRAVRNLYYTVLNHTLAMNDEIRQLTSDYEGGVLDFAIAGFPYESSVRGLIPNDGGDERSVTYRLTEGSLPEGIELDADGDLTGICEETGSWTFGVTAEYKTTTKQAEFTLIVADSERSVIYTKTGDVSYGYIGEEYRCDVGWAYTMTDVEVPIRYELAETSLLPAGLTLGEDGVISGTPQYYCRDYEFTVVASGEGLISMSLDLTISVFDRFSFESKDLKTGTFYRSYFDDISFGDYPDAVYSLKNGSTLPDGLRLTESGYIIGVPEECVTDWKFTVVASGDHYASVEREFSIDIGLAYDPMLLDSIEKGQATELFVNFAEGSLGITYSIADGKLPDGMTMDEAGRIYGTPTEAGNYSFIVRASAPGMPPTDVMLSLYVSGNPEGVSALPVVVIAIAGTVIIVGAVVAIMILVRRNKKKKEDK